MNKTFDQLVKEIVGENIMAATQPNQQNQQQNKQQYQTTPGAQPPQQVQQNQQNQQGDEELLKTLQQKLADEKFKNQLLALLNNQQPVAQ